MSNLKMSKSNKKSNKPRAAPSAALSDNGSVSSSGNDTKPIVYVSENGYNHKPGCDRFKSNFPGASFKESNGDGNYGLYVNVTATTRLPKTNRIVKCKISTRSYMVFKPKGSFYTIQLYVNDHNKEDVFQFCINGGILNKWVKIDSKSFTTYDDTNGNMDFEGNVYQHGVINLTIANIEVYRVSCVIERIIEEIENAVFEEQEATFVPEQEIADEYVPELASFLDISTTVPTVPIVPIVQTAKAPAKNSAMTFSKIAMPRNVPAQKAPVAFADLSLDQQEYEISSFPEKEANYLKVIADLVKSLADKKEAYFAFLASKDEKIRIHEQKKADDEDAKALDEFKKQQEAQEKAFLAKLKAKKEINASGQAVRNQVSELPSIIAELSETNQAHLQESTQEQNIAWGDRSFDES